MIETIVMDHLSAALDVSVWMEMPKNPPARFVIVEKTSDKEENFIHYPMVAVQSYAESLFQAAVLNELVERAMASLSSHPAVSRCKLNSSYNFTDTEKKRHRYQAVFDIVYMKE